MNLEQQIMRAATDIAERRGINALTRDDIAAKVPCSGGSVSYHMGDAKHLKRAVVVAAIENKNLRVLGWACAEKHPSVAKLDVELQAAAMRVHLSR